MAHTAEGAAGATAHRQTGPALDMRRPGLKWQARFDSFRRLDGKQLPTDKSNIIDNLGDEQTLYDFLTPDKSPGVRGLADPLADGSERRGPVSANRERAPRTPGPRRAVRDEPPPAPRPRRGVRQEPPSPPLGGSPAREQAGLALRLDALGPLPELPPFPFLQAPAPADPGPEDNGADPEELLEMDDDP